MIHKALDPRLDVRYFGRYFGRLPDRYHPPYSPVAERTVRPKGHDSQVEYGSLDRVSRLPVEITDLIFSKLPLVSLEAVVILAELGGIAP